jgi:hypothetical protein
MDNYYRLNVDVGVGEFGMNEWNRLADISTNTRRYLASSEVQSMNVEAATKLARIYRANQRWFQVGQNPNRYSWEVERPIPAPPAIEGAVELPAEAVLPYPHTAIPQPTISTNQNTLSAPQNYHRTSDDDKFVVQAPEPQQWEKQQQLRQRRSGDLHLQNPSGSTSFPQLPRRSNESGRPSAPQSSSQSLPDVENPRPHNPNEPPPLPPKTPINGPPPPGAPPPALPVTAAGHTSVTSSQGARLTRPPGGINVLPYPNNDGPPGAPPVNWGRKPEIGGMR